MVNKIPCGASEEAPCPFKTNKEWDSTFANIKAKFPAANAVRLYSTMDFQGWDAALHLSRALGGIKSHDMKIVAGLFSGGPKYTGRFVAELGALEIALTANGCENIAAVSVGNDDLEMLNRAGGTPDEKSTMVDMLVAQIMTTRSLLRQHGCCDIPVTHTDFWSELWNQSNSWVPKVSRLSLSPRCVLIHFAAD